MYVLNEIYTSRRCSSFRRNLYFSADRSGPITFSTYKTAPTPVYGTDLTVIMSSLGHRPIYIA